MSDPIRCPQCGQTSADPEWCEHCGADLAAAQATELQLRIGDRLTLALPPPRPATTSRPRITAPRPHTRMDADTMEVPTLLRPTELVITDFLADLGTRQLLVARGDDGLDYRLEVLVGTHDDDPDLAAALPELVDTPIATPTQDGTTIRVFRHVSGRLLNEMREELSGPPPIEVLVEWVHAILDAVERVHDAGYLSLKLCPYTIKFRSDGSVFLQNVGGVYPASEPLTALPAISGYSAPEIYHGEFDGNPGAAADVFSIAMVVYYLIAGFDPPTSMYTGYMPAVSARAFCPDFPVGFERFLVFGGAARPSDRPQTIAGLRALVDECASSVRDRENDESDYHYIVTAETHPGIVKRVTSGENQDRVFARRDPKRKLALIGVFDGVSTAEYGSGDQASEIGVQRLLEAWDELREAPEDLQTQGPARWLHAQLQAINFDIVAWINDRYAPFDTEPVDVMGSTAVLLLAFEGTAYVCSLGDSRAYLMREGYMEQVTRDHNLTTLGLAEGIPADQALTMAHGEALARCLGTFEYVPGGTLAATRVEPDLIQFELTDGDTIVLCSDGLTDYASATPQSADLAIYETVMGAGRTELAAIELIALANRGGGGDNIGVALLSVHGSESSLFDWLEGLRPSLPPNDLIADDALTEDESSPFE